MRKREIQREIYEEIEHKVLAHTIMQAEKSHDLPSISWRSGEAEGINSNIMLKA